MNDALSATDLDELEGRNETDNEVPGWVVVHRTTELLPLIAELRASRKVVAEARYIAETEPWHDANVRELKELLAELDNGVASRE